MQLLCFDANGCVCVDHCKERGSCVFRPPQTTAPIATDLTGGDPLVVLLDVDEVVADLLPAWLNKYNREWNDTLTPAQVTDWDLCQFVKPVCGTLIYGYLDSPKLYDDVQPIAGALDGVMTLRARGHKVKFVTSAMNGHAGAKLRWLQKHGFLPFGKKVDPDYIESSDKSIIRGDVLVDDRPKNVAEFPGEAILFHAAHNASFAWSGIRATGWPTTLQKIEELALDKKFAREHIADTIRGALIDAEEPVRYVQRKVVPNAGAKCGTCGSAELNENCGVCRSLIALQPSTANLEKSDPKSKPSNPKDIIGSNKLPLTLFPATAIAMGSVGMLNGLCKYGRDNFRAIGIRASIYLDALLRHTFAFSEGEECDPDDDVPHLAAMLACIGIIVDARAAGKMVDDRKVAGGYLTLLRELAPHVARLKKLHEGKNPKHYTIADNLSSRNS